MSQWPMLEKAKYTGRKGVEEEKNKNYAAAVKFYEQCIGYCLQVIKYEALTDEVKDVMRIKVETCQEKSERLQSHLVKNELSRRRKQHYPYTKR